MASYFIYRLRRGDPTLQSLGIECEDFKAVREAFRTRGRSENEQFVVMYDGLIHAIERSDGEGFALVEQYRQNAEDDVWYPPKKRSDD